MSPLQWLLLILAVAAVVSFYIWTKRRGGPDPWQDMRSKDPAGDELAHAQSLSASGREDEEPNVFDGLLGADDIPDMPDGSSVRQQDDDDLPGFDIRDELPEEDLQVEKAPDLNPAGLQRRPEPAQQRIVVLHVACKKGHVFLGEAVHEALAACRLQYGMQQVYHRITETNGVPETIYSVANMLKPGFLNPDDAATLETPGLTLFMVLPGPIDGPAAFRDMLDTAHGLAEQLGGDVLDDKRVPLKRQTAQFLMDEIAEDHRKLQLKQHA